jgi:hypothetical protein
MTQLRWLIALAAISMTASFGGRLAHAYGDVDAYQVDDSTLQSGQSIDSDSPDFHGGGGGHGGGGHGGGGFHPGPGPHPFPHPHPGGGHHWDPYPIHHGYHPWPHWGHPFFPRPVYYWDWNRLREVTCTAQDSAGDLYPVTEDAYTGIEYQSELQSIEDAALDRCYSESNGDEGCTLEGCVPVY